jgi:hypothetical protein
MALNARLRCFKSFIFKVGKKFCLKAKLLSLEKIYSKTHFLSLPKNSKL